MSRGKQTTGTLVYNQMGTVRKNIVSAAIYHRDQCFKKKNIYLVFSYICTETTHQTIQKIHLTVQTIHTYILSQSCNKSLT